MVVGPMDNNVYVAAVPADRRGPAGRRGQRARGAARGVPAPRGPPGGRDPRPLGPHPGRRRRCARPGSTGRGDRRGRRDAPLLRPAARGRRRPRGGPAAGAHHRHPGAHARVDVLRRRGHAAPSSAATPCSPGGPGNTKFEGGDFPTIIRSIEDRLFARYTPRRSSCPATAPRRPSAPSPPPPGVDRPGLVRRTGPSHVVSPGFPVGTSCTNRVGFCVVKADQSSRLSTAPAAARRSWRISDLHVRADGTEILRGVDLERRRGRGPRPDGPERGRQVDARQRAPAGHPGYEVTGGAIRLEGEDVTALADRGPRQGRPVPGLPVPRGHQRRLGHPVPAPGDVGPPAASTSRCSRCASP